jgi:hypothetical protein
MTEQRLPRFVRVRLTEEMAQALYALSVREERVPTDQAKILLRDQLIKLGYLRIEPVEIGKHILEPAG